MSFTASDGVPLHGWLIAGGVPTTLLYSQGNAGNMGDRVAIARLLVEQLGVGVFMYDYRGYGRSDGVPSESGLARDVRAAREALLREGVASRDVAYLGRSLGTAVTVDLALAHPPRAVILEASFLSVPAMANAVLPGVGYLFRTRWDSLTKIARLQAPLLVIHGGCGREVIPYAPRAGAVRGGPGTQDVLHGARRSPLSHGARSGRTSGRRGAHSSGARVSRSRTGRKARRKRRSLLDNRFTEGLDTADLRTAKALLDELSAG